MEKRKICTWNPLDYVCALCTRIYEGKILKKNLRRKRCHAPIVVISVTRIDNTCRIFFIRDAFCWKESLICLCISDTSRQHASLFLPVTRFVEKSHWYIFLSVTRHKNTRHFSYQWRVLLRGVTNTATYQWRAWIICVTSVISDAFSYEESLISCN
jgi:hypothetical protein